MKILKYITVETETEVDVSSEDIAAAFAETPEGHRHALAGINNAAAFIKAITPEMIAEMGGARPTIAKFFREQAERFEVNDQSKPPANGGVS